MMGGGIVLRGVRRMRACDEQGRRGTLVFERL